MSARPYAYYSPYAYAYPYAPIAGAPRQLEPTFTPSSSVSVFCGEESMTVSVQLNLYGNGKMAKISDLKLGPQACSPGTQSTDTVAIFENLLQDCSKPVQMNDDWIFYSTFLTYSPRPASGVPIYRSSPALVPIDCLYPRHGNVSSKAIQPTWVPFATTLTSEERLAFSLQLMTDDWSGFRSSSVFLMGGVFNINASVNTYNHYPLILYVDQCVATLTENPDDSPRYLIIQDNGCLVDGKEPDASSAFRPRPRLNELHFSVDVFRFLNEASSTVLKLKVGNLQAPAIGSVAPGTNILVPQESWIAHKHFPHSMVCILASSYAQLEKHEVRLGPLVVIGAVDQPIEQDALGQAYVKTQESKPMELWVLVAVVSVSLVVVATGVIVAVKLLLHKTATEETPIGTSSKAPTLTPSQYFVSSPKRVMTAYTPGASEAVSVACGAGSMMVAVRLDLYGNGKMAKISDLKLGPQTCSPGTQSTDTVAIFENLLQDCSKPVQMNDDWILYSTYLTYSPRPSSNAPIYRSSPAMVPIDCLYPRHGNVSSNAIQPTWVPFGTTLTSEERLAFSLHLMTDDWSNIRSSLTFLIGGVFNIEASVETQNHLPMILFVDRCVASLSEDPQSTPNYDIITDNGCLVDGRLEEASSSFEPRQEPNKLHFTVDVFRFLNEERSTIFITCYLRVVPATQPPDPMNKACSYSKNTRSWTPVEGSASICQCCNTGTCGAAPILSSGARSMGSPFGRPRFGKRDVGHSEYGQAKLGPLVVVAAADHSALQDIFSQASSTTRESNAMELWVLVAVVSVSLVVVAAGVTVTVKRLLHKCAHRDPVEK
ncbi:uncharacterized protein PAF06_010092 [Gastrophryne carolinensis]